MPNFKNTQEVEKLAADHWTYIKELLQKHGENHIMIDKLSFHYQTAFVHGYKHCLEDWDRTKDCTAKAFKKV